MINNSNMLLSIITINYNNQKGLKKTIESVISQTQKPFEWIIIDGGSNDGSIDTIKMYSHHFSFWISEKDNGIYNAMNKGITKATGDYLLFLNSGDYLFSNKVLETMTNEDMKYDIIYGFIMREKNGKLYPQKNFTKDTFTLSDFCRNSLPHQASFIKRESFKKWGMYDENLIVASDWKFFVEAIIWGNASVKYIDYPISVFQDGGISSDKSQKNESYPVLESLLPTRIMPDLIKAVSLSEVLDSKICSHLYKLLYRIACVLNKIK